MKRVRDDGVWNSERSRQSLSLIEELGDVERKMCGIKIEELMNIKVLEMGNCWELCGKYGDNER
jgi:hypothetical protein